MTSYFFRKSALEKGKTFSLDEDALVIDDAASASIRVPFKDITTIRLSYAPDRMRRNNFQCAVESPQGKYAFMSTSYVSLANFKSDSQRYATMVKELISKVAAANPTVSLVSGKPKFAYRLSIILMIAGFLAVAMLIYFLGETMSSVSWMKFILILLLIPMAFSYIMKNKPGTFSAESIPANLLPA
jgi:hypothetical protein